MSINSSDLDFYDIKSKLKTYFKKSEEFKDYDFDASGLSNILDVLAYNTHINGLTANMSINESFLSTSQIRSSVVSHAESLGYFPKSPTGARAFVNVKVPYNGIDENWEIDEGTRFFASIDQVNYEFFTTESHVASRSGDYYEFNDISIVQGKIKRKTFIADGSVDVPYVIPDDTIDTSTIKIEVNQSGTTAIPDVYKNILNVPYDDENSTVYMVRESMNGNYEIIFGDGKVLGKRPEAGNIIVVQYISTDGPDGNGAKKFFLNESYSAEVETSSVSAGGAIRENIDSIKMNAPVAFSAQNRLVTAQDYEGLIQTKFGQYFDDVACWGGNDNIPPKFGSVFVALNFRESLSSSTKDEIKDLIRENLTDYQSIMSIDTEFVEPESVYLRLTTTFNVDPKLSTLNSQQYRQEISTLISEYFSTEMNPFGSVFRRSNLLTRIDDYSPAILNSKMSVVAQRRLDIRPYFEEIDTYNQQIGEVSPDFIERDITVNFPFLLATPDKDDHVIITSPFRYYNQNAVIKNELGSYKLQVFDMSGNVLVSNVGDYQPANGEVNFRAWRMERDTVDIIKVTATPANQSTITPLRNYLFELDDDSTVMVNLETDGTRVLL